MRTIGTISCLLLMILMGGLLYRAQPVSGTKIPAPADQTAASPLREADYLFESGEYDKAAAAFLREYRSAVAHDEKQLAARCLWKIGNCQFARFRYQQAIETFLKARSAFEAFHDLESVQALNGSLSSVYFQ